MATPQILHLDMDAFFAAVEQRDRPELREKPVLVGGSPEGRGVICAASYEARRFGCRSAMPTATALRLCPQAILIPTRISRYREVSRQLFALFEEFSPLVEPLSIDEAFLDLTGTQLLFGTPEETARRLKARVREETGLTASVGVAPNKFLAKLASDLRKPDGLVVIEPDQVQAVLDPLPVEQLWGVGVATLRRFQHLGVTTVAGVRRLPLDRLLREFGAAGEQFHRLARGIDTRPVCPDRQAKSIGHEVTFAQDVEDADYLRTVLLHQTEDVAYRLRQAGLYARSVILKLRYPDFTTIARSGTLPEPTQTTKPLCQAARHLLEAWPGESRRRNRIPTVRLLGIAASGLVGGVDRQLSLFEEAEAKQKKLDDVVDALRHRFGPDAVRRSGPLRPGGG